MNATLLHFFPRAAAIVAALLSQALGCTSTTTCRKAPNLFGAYNFTIADAAPSAQLTFLKEIGYQGVVTEWKGEPEHHSFANDQMVLQRHVSATASIPTMTINVPVDRAFWSATLKALRGSQRFP